MKVLKKYVNPYKVEITQVSALINGIKHTFIGNRIFTDFGVEIK